MASSIDARTVKSWLADGREVAFIDVREHGQYGEAHPFLATSVPYSRFEPSLVALVPNANVPVVLIDAGDGVAERAARRAEALGYQDVRIVAGGVDGWKSAGYTLFAGVNVPSKTFGELVEIGRHTPRVTAAELVRMRDAGERLVIVDGRPFAEFERMNIPGGICCPNGELALRIHDIAPDPATTIVVNCAGRTRSIIGAQTLIDLGVPNHVVALENGTQGWFLAGLELERGARRRHSSAAPPPAKLAALAERVGNLAKGRGVETVDAVVVQRWLAAADRTNYVLDVRSPEEFAEGSAPICASAPGGQLIQATDQWVGVKGARIVLVDDDGVRAPMVAQWLRQLGHEAVLLWGGIAAAASLKRPATVPRWLPPGMPTIAPERLAGALPKPLLLDTRSSTAYRAGHIAGAVWGCRPRIAAVLPAEPTHPIVIAGDGSGSNALAAVDVAELGFTDVAMLDAGPQQWTAAGLPIETTPDLPPDKDCIDYLFFVHDRHDGNAAAARRYIEWEMGLLDQLDDDERKLFKVAAV